LENTYGLFIAIKLVTLYASLLLTCVITLNALGFKANYPKLV